MKGLVIFHDHELAFCHADKDLEKYLKERWDLLQKSAGATVSDETPRSSPPSSPPTTGSRLGDEGLEFHFSGISPAFLHCLCKLWSQDT